MKSHASRLQQALANAGAVAGDRAAGLLPHGPEAVAAMLATVSLGAVWCAASPDFGAHAALDRFGRIEPKALLATDGCWHAGKRFEIGRKLGAIVRQLPSLSRTVVIDHLGSAQKAADDLHDGSAFTDFDSAFAAAPPSFTWLPFDHPLCIVFSSGGVLLQHIKEHALHADVKPGDALLFFTQWRRRPRRVVRDAGARGGADRDPGQEDQDRDPAGGPRPLTCLP